MRFFYLFLAGLVCLWGCSQSPSSTSCSWYQDNGGLKVLSTTAMIDDLVGEIGKDRVDHIPLIIGEVDPHSYELVKGDDEKLSSADLVIANGLHLEHGASLLQQLQKLPNVVFLGDAIKEKIPERILYIEGELDPHIWMDISLWAEGIDFVVAALIEKDPEYACFYQENGIALYQKMLMAHEEICSALHGIPEEKRYLVTSHDAFHYFARAYLGENGSWENRCVAPEGIAPEGRLSTQDIKRVIEHLCSHQIGVVFPESNVARSALKKIVLSCEHRGLKVHICPLPLYGDAMGAAGSCAANYLGMIRHNAEVLKGEWEK